jgi:hypothetical protein
MITPLLSAEHGKTIIGQEKAPHHTMQGQSFTAETLPNASSIDG